MPIEARGRPLHTRTLEISIRGASPLRVEGRILDIRHSTYAPMADRLQLAGVIHDMFVRLEVEPESREILSLSVDQPTVAFEPGAATAGESCRDPAGSLGALVGATIDAGFTRRVGEVHGGPRGCTHLFTLTSAVGAALLQHLKLYPDGSNRGEDELVFRRTTVLDYLLADRRLLTVAAQQSDFSTRPEREVGHRFERLRRQHEIAAAIEVGVPDRLIRGATLRERIRPEEDLANPDFRDRSGDLIDLHDQPILGGAGKRIYARFGADPDDAPLLDLMLQIPVGFIQSLPPLAEPMFVHQLTSKDRPGRAGEAPKRARKGMGNACYMWRDGGPWLTADVGES